MSVVLLQQNCDGDHPTAMTAYDFIKEVIESFNSRGWDQSRLKSLADRHRLREDDAKRIITEWSGKPVDQWLSSLETFRIRNALVLAVERHEETARIIRINRANSIDSSGQHAQRLIRYGVGNSPYGSCMIGETEEGICHLSFFDKPSPEPEIAQLQKQWPDASLIQDDSAIKSTATRLFASGAKGKDSEPIEILVRGTDFQVLVWRTLLQIPSGSLVTYAKLAELAGRATAHRAVASAVARNHLGYLIPCHRVVRSTGIVGDFRWGTVRKQAMIAREICRFESSIDLAN